MADKHDTHSRALKLNLDPALFGTFAEIGAGQEVARWFLQVGGAAGTVAKTISAYDMKVSDDIYGKGTRYVSRDRLLAMLDHEYSLLIERLDAQRGEKTHFFVLADTVSARNYAGTNECHGWMGVRFQTSPRSEPSDVLLHVNLMDPTNLQQQRALGVLGVNLLCAATYERNRVETFLYALFTDLSLDRLEIDVVEFSGRAFEQADPQRLGVRLVHAGLARAVLFRPDGVLVQPADLLRKRPLVIERGLFERITPLHAQMLEEANAKLRDEVNSEREPLSLPELSVKPVQGREAPDEEEAQRRVSGLLEMGHPVLLTRFPEIYHMTAYLRRHTREPARLVLGASTLIQVLHSAFYAELAGGLLEALGRLLAENVKLYSFPMQVDTCQRLLAEAGIPPVELEGDTRGWVTADRIKLDPPVDHLYRYLLDAGWVVGLEPPETTTSG